MGMIVLSVDLMWSLFDDNIGVDYYDIYREIEGLMKKIVIFNIVFYMDKNLFVNIIYKYVVKVVDVVGNEFV